MKYKIKLAENWNEIKEAQRLRTASFELKKFDDYDGQDNYDDHLLLYETLLYGNEKLIGTMRLRQSKSSRYPLYASQEFELNGFEKKLLNHNFLEIGRLCTLKNAYRYTPLMLLLAEFEYAKARKIENFVGCTSFYLENPQEAEDIFLLYEKEDKTVSRENLIKAKEAYKIPFNSKIQKNPNPEMPSLAGIYFEAGAKIISEPAWDKEFKKRGKHCIDYLMAGNVKKIPNKFEKVFSYAKSNLEIDERIFGKTLTPVWKRKREKKHIFFISINNKFTNPLSKLNNKIKQKRFQKRYELTA